eukprot:scaffold451_cov365-Prasinococcus_capsulatus_cf.AAC.23
MDYSPAGSSRPRQPPWHERLPARRVTPRGAWCVCLPRAQLTRSAAWPRCRAGWARQPPWHTTARVLVRSSGSSVVVVAVNTFSALSQDVVDALGPPRGWASASCA